MRNIGVIAVVLFALAGAPALSDVIVTMNTTAEGGDMPIIIGQTNLPDGTELIVSLSRRASSYGAQDKTSVRNGSFRAGPFSQHGGALNPGIYDVEVTAGVAWVQPKSVQAIIGKNGEKLDGPLVEMTDLGAKMVEYHSDLQIGTGAGSAELDKTSREAQRKMLHDWWIDSCQSTCDLSAGYAKSKSRSFDWESCHETCLDNEP